MEKGGVDVQIRVFLTSALVGGEWSALSPCSITPAKDSRYLLDRRLDGPQRWSGWCGEVKILHHTGTWNPTPGSSSPYPSPALNWDKCSSQDGAMNLRLIEDMTERCNRVVGTVTEHQSTNFSRSLEVQLSLIFRQHYFQPHFSRLSLETRPCKRASRERNINVPARN
jgi:hypothetical protein